MTCGYTVMKNWALSVDHSQLYIVQVLVHHIDLLSILFRGNGFTRIQKAIVDQTGSRPPDSDRDLFWGQVWLWEVLWSFFLVQSLSWLSSVIVENPLFIARHSPIKKLVIVVARIREDDTLK